ANVAPRLHVFGGYAASWCLRSLVRPAERVAAHLLGLTGSPRSHSSDQGAQPRKVSHAQSIAAPTSTAIGRSPTRQRPCQSGLTACARGGRRVWPHVSRPEAQA